MESKVCEVTTTIPEASYIVGSDGAAKDLLIANQEQTETSQIDYELPVPEGAKRHKEPLPLSYLSITSLEEGEEWYRSHYPQMPEELFPMMARYSFGDLGQWSHKELKNYKRKAAKRKQKETIKISMEPGTLHFE